MSTFSALFRSELVAAIEGERRRAKLEARLEEVLLTRRIAEFEDLLAQAKHDELQECAATFERDLVMWRGRRDALRAAADLAGHDRVE